MCATKLEVQGMQIILPFSSLAYITLSFLYIELCCCIMIDREKRDRIDSLTQQNCDGIPQSAYEAGRCKCVLSVGSSIASTKTGGIACVSNKDIDSSKYT